MHIEDSITFSSSFCLYFADPTTLAGYQAVPENCPGWKQAMIEKKNTELVEKAKVQGIVINTY